MVSKRSKVVVHKGTPAPKPKAKPVIPCARNLVKREDGHWVCRCHGTDFGKP